MLGLNSPIGIYIPGFYPYLLSEGLIAFNSNIDFFLYVRLVNLCIALFLLLYFSNVLLGIFSQGLGKVASIIPSFLISLFLLTYMIAMRAFEVRPEALGSLSIALSFCYLLYSHRGTNRHTLYFLISSLFSILAVQLSTRYVIPIAFVWLASLVFFMKERNLNLKGGIVIISLMILLSISLFMQAHNLQDLVVGLNRAGEINSLRTGYTIYEKFLVLGFGKFPVLRQSVFYPDLLRIVLFASFFILAIFSVWFLKDRSKKLIIILLTFSNLSVVLFLVFFDFMPYNYAVIHEVLFIFLSSVYIISALINQSKGLGNICRIGMFSLAAYLFIPSLLVIDINQPRLDNFIHSSSDLNIIDINNKNKGEIAELRSKVGVNSSAIYQLNVMKKFCSLYENAFVFSSGYFIHPVCIADEKSYPVSIGKENYNDAVSKIISLNNVVFQSEKYIVYEKSD